MGLAAEVVEMKISTTGSVEVLVVVIVVVSVVDCVSGESGIVEAVFNDFVSA